MTSKKTAKAQEELLEILKFTPRIYTMYIGGYGGEAYAGIVDKKIYNYFAEKKIDLDEYAGDWDGKFSELVPHELQPFNPGSPYDCDGLFHASGAELSNLNEITVQDENGDDHWVCAAGLNELEDEGVTVDSSGGFDFDDLLEDQVAFYGAQGEKGSFFEGEIELKAPFDPKKLSIQYENCDGWWIISSVEYDGEDVDGSNGYSTSGKWGENKWVLGDGERPYEPVSAEDSEDDEDSDEDQIAQAECVQCDWRGAVDDTYDVEGQMVCPECREPVEVLEETVDSIEIMYGYTDWFPTDVKPVRKGLYQVDLGDKSGWPFGVIVKAEWTGRTWKDLEGKKIKFDQWRGLARDPAGV